MAALLRRVPLSHRLRCLGIRSLCTATAVASSRLGGFHSSLGVCGGVQGLGTGGCLRLRVLSTTLSCIGAAFGVVQALGEGRRGVLCGGGLRRQGVLCLRHGSLQRRRTRIRPLHHALHGGLRGCLGGCGCALCLLNGRS